jgi:hypothetical protein
MIDAWNSHARHRGVHGCHSASKDRAVSDLLTDRLDQVSPFVEQLKLQLNVSVVRRAASLGIESGD